VEGYIRLEDRIYNIVEDKNVVSWKSVLYELIEKENLDPWDIDLSILTNKYLKTIKNLKNIDFEISGKLLLVAIFLLKLKVEFLLNKDIRGIEEKIIKLENEDFNDNLEELENFSEDLDNLEIVNKKKKKEYNLKYRNPIARKRKVTIVDLIEVLEKTLERSKIRRENILARKRKVEYNGPTYSPNKKDLKELVDELYEILYEELIKNKKSQVRFSNLISKKSKEEILNKFFPLLHLSYNNKVKLEQNKLFGEIFIKKNIYIYKQFLE